MPVVVAETPDKPDPNHVLTWRQRKVLQVIRDSVRNRGYPPSMQEIAHAVGLTSTSSVLYQVSILQRKGYLHRDAGRPRTMEVRLPGRPPVRPEGAVADSARDEQAGATLSSRELITSLASRRAELGLSRAEVARRMQTSQAAVARLEAQLATLARYTEALGLLAADVGHTRPRRLVAPHSGSAHLRPLGWKQPKRGLRHTGGGCGRGVLPAPGTHRVLCGGCDG